MTGAAVDADFLEQLKTILRRDLKLGPTAYIADDMPLIGGQLDLDSLDILLLVSSVEKLFAIKIPNESVGRTMFQDVSTLARFIQETRTKATDTVGGLPRTTSSNGIDYLASLPHGPGFRFVTKVLEVEPQKSARGQWIVNGSEPFFADHFPGNPIVPGVLLIESFAQISGIAIAAGTESKQGMLVSADVRFDEAVSPPATIEVNATLSRAVGPLQLCDVTATVGGAIVARGTVTIRVM